MRPIAIIAGFFAGSLALAFCCSLAVEDQRNYVACRIGGAGLDACILQISGR